MKRTHMVGYMLTGCLIAPASTCAAENEGESVFSTLTITDNSQAEASHVHRLRLIRF